MRWPHSTGTWHPAEPTILLSPVCQHRNLSMAFVSQGDTRSPHPFYGTCMQGATQKEAHFQRAAQFQRGRGKDNTCNLPCVFSRRNSFNQDKHVLVSIRLSYFFSNSLTFYAYILYLIKKDKYLKTALSLYMKGQSSVRKAFPSKFRVKLCQHLLQLYC